MQVATGWEDGPFHLSGDFPLASRQDLLQVEGRPQNFALAQDLFLRPPALLNDYGLPRIRP